MFCFKAECFLSADYFLTRLTVLLQGWMLSYKLTVLFQGWMFSLCWLFSYKTDHFVTMLTILLQDWLFCYNCWLFCYKADCFVNGLNVFLQEWLFSYKAERFVTVLIHALYNCAVPFWNYVTWGVWCMTLLLLFDI